jgi:two-component system, NarL family, invasion response regulator UvrY
MKMGGATHGARPVFPRSLHASSLPIRHTTIMRILIVDDSDIMRGFLSGMMTDCHHVTQGSVNGAEAVDAYLTFKPDLVLMDIRMPVMDGIEATERILRLDAGARVAIVTECDEPTYRESALRAGASAYFLKEDLRQLLSYIEQGPTQ